MRLIYFLSLIYLANCHKYDPIYNGKGDNVIVSNYKACARLAHNIIKKGGNGIDAAITVMLCEGLGRPQDSGLGGGFFGIVKLFKKNETFVINSRETAPLKLNTSSFDFYTSNKLFGKVVGVPSALKGYKKLHEEYGNLKWKNIVMPVAILANNGFPCVIGRILKKYQYMYLEEKYRNVFINNKTGLVYRNKETWIRKDLYKTLVDVSNNSDLFYSDKNYIDMFVKEINSCGGILESEDFFNVEPLKYNPLTVYYNFNGKRIKLETTDLPGGGISVAFVLGIVEKFIEQYKTIDERLNYVIIEALKYAFSFRTNFGDQRYHNMYGLANKILDKDFQKTILEKIMITNYTQNDSKYYHQRFAFLPDSGTANIVVKTENELLVLTSTINLRFGSWIISKSGIVFNNQMSDFSLPNRYSSGSLPPSIYNFPEHGKYPISSIATSIISVYDDKTKEYHPQYALGAAGGPKIISSIVQVINNVINKKMNIIESINYPRFHHQLDPNELQIEKRYYSNNTENLREYGYNITYMKGGDYSAVTGIEMYKGNISGTYDPRRPGGVIVF